MKIRTLFYVIGQGFKSLFKNKMFTLASIATIASCLFLFDLIASIFINLRLSMQKMEEGVSITVFFEEGLSDIEKNAIGESILSRSEEVASCCYVSGDQAWEEFKEDYLEGYADGFTENPLANSDNYEVYLKDVSKQNDVVNYIKGLPGVRKVNSSEVTANILSGMNSLIIYVAFGIIFILLGVSVFLISNTVMIGISVRKEEIAIMKFIGATDFFVRSPFIIEGVLIGAIGSAVPLAVVYYLYDEAIRYITERFAVLETLMRTANREMIFHYLGPVNLIIGVGIGFIGSAFTVKKHLRV